MGVSVWIMFRKIKITEYQFYLGAIDVSDGPTFLVTNSLFVSSLLKSLQVPKFDRADNSLAR